MPTIGLIHYNNPDYYPPTYNAARLLRAQGWGVEILCRRIYRNYISDYGAGISLIRVGPPEGQSIINYLGALKWLQAGCLASKKWDAVLGFDAFGGMLAAQIASRRKIPFLFHCYDFYAPHELRWVERRIWSRLLLHLKKARAVIFPSSEKAEFFRKETGYQGPIEVVANSPIRRTKSPPKKSDPIFRLHYQGSLHHRLGLQEIVNLLPELPSNIHLSFMGPSRDGFRTQLKTFVTDKTLDSRVNDLGEVSHLDLLHYTESANVGLFLPTDTASNLLYSGSAVNKLNEYLAAGIPAVVSPIPALERWARETGACLVVDPRNKNELRKTILKLYEYPEDYAGLCEMAFAAHQKVYNFEKQYLPILNCFKSLLE